MEGGLAGNLPAKAKGMVTIGRDSCDRLIRLIGDLLDLSKFEAGKMPLEFKNVNAKSLVSKAASEFKSTASNDNVHIAEEVDEDCVVFADGDRIMQVLVNLISNALKFSPENSTITISAKHCDGDRVRFAVKDEAREFPNNRRVSCFKNFSNCTTPQQLEARG